MAKLNAPKGTFDLATPRVDLYQRVEAAARKIFARHGFTEIRTPIFESTDLFARGVGEGTDLVNKEMYTFTDRGGRSLTLRPEGTAPVMRALIENGLAEKLLHQRVYYLGPMFRYERPQKGRYRQFHQIGAEVIGEVPPALEAEVVAMLFSFLRELGLHDLRLTINSIGDKNCRSFYLDTLGRFVKENWDKLCAECHDRYERNVLRCLDCKNENCRAVYVQAPRITDHLCEACAAHHRDFKAALALEKVEFVENPNLVRGLDYYRRTAFEVTAEGLGSQDALLGGGRYDDLIKELGGPPLPGFGFGIGLDRLVLALDHANLACPETSALCAILFDPADAAVQAAHDIAQELRAAEIPTYLSPKPGPLGPQFKWAGKLFSDVELLTARNQMPFALIIGENEIANHTFTIKQMITGEQIVAPRAQLHASLQQFLLAAANSASPQAPSPKPQALSLPFMKIPTALASGPMPSPAAALPLAHPRSHYCGEVNDALIGQTVQLNGWVRSVREMGGLTFVGLADREGLVQVVVEQTDAPELHKLAKGLRSEFVITVEGVVAARGAGAINAQMRTGAVEVRASKIEILASAEVPPFPIDEKAQVSEDLGLKYRYLNLRLPALQKNLTLRHRLSLATRNYLSGLGFLEIETPFLYKSTPEGAREFLVPSRVHAGKFYALPQSPQLFKQLLMMAGYDRYFQIVRCFRDEDLRADRQPEFTQIDLEISYPNEETVITLIEGLLKTLWLEAGHEIQIPFRRMGHAEAMEHYGSDRPDLRYDLKLSRHDDWAAAGDNEFFKQALADGGSVRGLRVPGGAKYSRKDFDGLTEHAKKHGAGGMAFLKWGEEGVTGSVAKSFTPESMQAEFTRIAGEKGDAILFCAGDSDRALKGLGAVRQEVARREKIIPQGAFNFLWVVDFPLFEKMDDGSPKSAHHPFTAPQAAHEAALADANSDPFAIRARAYDITLNGIELGGGSIRIHNAALQKTLFRRIGLDDAQMQDKFGFLLEALSYGTPPHGGIALGFDRLCALLCGADSLREVIAFPKTTQAADLMVETPSTVTDQQLQDLHIKTRG